MTTSDEVLKHVIETQKEIDKLVALRMQVEQARLKAIPPLVHISGEQPGGVRFPHVRRAQTRVPENEFSFVRLLTARATGDWSGAKFEQMAVEESRRNLSSGLFSTMQRALSWANGSGGGYWVGPEFLPQDFIDALGAAIVCRKAGCKVLPCTGAPVNIPKITAGATAYWIGQNASITASDQTPGELSLSPKFCVARTQVGQFLANSSEGAVEALVREDLARVLGRAIDDAMLEGNLCTATPNIIEGLANTASIQNVGIGTNGGALTMAHLYSMKYKLDLANVDETGRCWLMPPRTLNGIQQFLRNSETQNYVFQQDQSKAPPQFLLGYPVYTSTQLAINLSKGGGTEGGVNLARLFLVNIRDVVLAEWGGVRIQSTDVGGQAWEYDMIEVKAVAAVDMGVRHAESICMIDDSTT